MGQASARALEGGGGTAAMRPRLLGTGKERERERVRVKENECE